MSDDTIRRAAALDGLSKLRKIDTYKIDGDPCLKVKAIDVYEMLKQLPSAQPEPQRAIWALHTYIPHNYYCTHCKKDSPYNKTWSYCPNCGCEMEGHV